MKISCIIVLVIAIKVVYPLQVILEHAKVLEYNDKYVVWGKSYVKRYGRNSPYYFNLEGQIKHQWANNITIHLLFYEYLHNEYRRSFVEIHLKLCDALNGDPYVGKMLANSGITCPLNPGTYHLMNMTIEAAEFPQVWPFPKCKVTVELRAANNKESIGIIEVLVKFVQKKRN